MALSAVLKVLKHGLVSEANPDAAEAMRAVADAVTLCRFEATDPDRDDVVLSKILHVLLECVTCPTGRLLGDDDVCNVVQACYRIGHQSGKESALLRDLSRHALREIVRVTFGRLPMLESVQQESTGAPTRAHIEGYVAAKDASREAEEKEDGREAEEKGASADPSAEGPSADPSADPSVGDSGTPKSPTKGPGADARAAAGGAEEVVGGGEVADALEPHSREPFGLACVLEIFRFAVSFVGFEEGGSGGDDLESSSESACAFGLQLVLASLESAGEDFARHPQLLRLVRDDLSRAILAAAPSGRPSVLAATAAAVLQLQMVMHSELKLQLEAFLRMVLLPLAEPGREDVSQESRRIALECVVDLCRQPTFAPDLYVNFDCDVDRPDVFEELASVLSRGAFPRDGEPFDAEHLLSLEGLLAITAGIAERSTSSEGLDALPADTLSAPPGSSAPEPDFARFAAAADERWALTLEGGYERAEALRGVRHLKRRLAVCAEHFNASPKKGLAYAQEVGALPDPLDPAATARFLRRAPRLDKEVCGEYLGDHKDFNVAVLGAYARAFDFADITLDKALRAFLDGFKLPGEAQKISRILEVFADRYYAANPDAVADADSAYVLSYSIIMLNTDQHNPQVKRKMTLEQFVRNNRGTNGGKDWPLETLESIFEGIVGDEIKLADDAAPSLSPSRWAENLRRASQTGDDRMIAVTDEREAAAYDADLFAALWRPVVAAASVVFVRESAAADESALREALDGFLSVAKIAGRRKMTEVMDHLVATLCAFATPPHLTGDGANGDGGGAGSSTKPSVMFGEDDRARTAAVAAFTVVNRYGDSLRRGWCDAVDLIVRLNRLELLSEKTLGALGVDERDGGPMRAVDGSALPRAGSLPKLKKKPSGSSSLLRGFSQLLSLEPDAWGVSGGGDQPLTALEREAEERAHRCVEACRVDEIFADSKFLEAESLTCLTSALAWAAGPGGAAGAAEKMAQTIGGASFEGTTTTAAGGDPDAMPLDAMPLDAMDEGTALFCLDALVGVTLRNRDRARLTLPRCYAFLRAIVRGAKTPGPLAERAIFELLRIARRLLPYKEDLTDELLDALRLMFALEPAVADACIERIARELAALVDVAGDAVVSAKGWDTVCKLLMASARHPDAAKHGFDAVRGIVRRTPEVDPKETRSARPANDEDHTSGPLARTRVRPWNARPALEALGAFADSRQGGDERSIHAVGLIADVAHALCEMCDGAADDGAIAVRHAALYAPPGSPATNSPAEALAHLRAETLEGAWADCVRELRRIATSEARDAVRDDAVLTLQRVVLAADGLRAPAAHWMRLMDDVLLPTLGDLGEACAAAGGGGGERGAAFERTALLAVSCVAKTFLMRLPAMLESASSAEFAAAWGKALDRMRSVGDAARGEELREAVPEAAKNMLLVAAAQGVLAPGAPEGLWETTWKRAAAIDPGLTPAIVGAS